MIEPGQRVVATVKGVRGDVTLEGTVVANDPGSDAFISILTGDFDTPVKVLKKDDIIEVYTVHGGTPEARKRNRLKNKLQKKYAAVVIDGESLFTVAFNTQMTKAKCSCGSLKCAHRALVKRMIESNIYKAYIASVME